MTDKQLIETLRNIKKRCKVCTDCEFELGGEINWHGYGVSNRCQIHLLAKELSGVPEGWDMEKIERIIND